MQNRDQSDKWWPRVGSSRKFTAPFHDRSSREMKRFPFACKAPPVDWPWTSVCHCENERIRRCVLLFARRPIPTWPGSDMLAKWGENIVIAGKRHQEIHVCVPIYKTREDGTKRTALSRGYLQKYHFGTV